MDQVVVRDEVDQFLAARASARRTTLLLGLFFVSGATGLTWQTVWARELHLVFGTSTFAIATVLAAFMAGLAVGGFAAARWGVRRRRPLAAYGWLEVGIGLFALLFPELLRLITPAYLALAATLGPSPWLFGALQFLLVGAMLLVPTAAMGATLPLLARFSADDPGNVGRRVGTLYAVNTAGAVFGTFACGFFLLPALGLSATTWLTAGCNLLLGAVALLLQRGGASEVAPEEASAPPNSEALIVVAAAIAGFASLLYEVAWTRVLGLMLGASVYAFSLMLLAFLIGIALGGQVGGWASDRFLSRTGRAGLLLGAAGVQVGVGVLSAGLLFLFPELPFWYVGIYDAFAASSSPLLVWAASMLLAVLVMTPPAFLMGAAFPLGVRAITASDPGGPVGRFYGSNTLGAVLGASTAGFLLLPALGMDRTVLVGVLANLLAAVALLVAARNAGAGWRVWPWLGAAAVTGAASCLLVLLPGTVEDQERRHLLMTAGMYKYVVDVSDHSRAGILRYAVEQYDLLYYAEGVSSVVTVAKNKESGNIWLANNGKVEASTTVDMPTQVLVSLLPFLYSDRPDDVLVIGLASGITAGSAGTVDGVRRLEIVELEPAIEPAARFFDAQNHRVLDDPRTRLVFNDGRNHVLLARPGSWDVVVSEPSNPWISGVSNLFTREFLALGRTRLKPGGVWAQWVQMYGMGRDDLRALLATFAEVYPHVALFMTVEDADLVILGSDRPLEPSISRFGEALARWPGARAELARVGLAEPERLLSTWQMGRAGVEQLTEGVALNTDDNMRIEYAAPLHLHASTSADNVEMLLKFAEIPPSLDAVGKLRLATLYLEREDFDRGLRAAELAFLEVGHADLHPRFRGLREREGWEKGVVALVGVAEEIAIREGPGSTWDREVARWRIALLGYFGEPVPASLTARATAP